MDEKERQLLKERLHQQRLKELQELREAWLAMNSRAEKLEKEHQAKMAIDLGDKVTISKQALSEIAIQFGYDFGGVGKELSREEARGYMLAVFSSYGIEINLNKDE